MPHKGRWEKSSDNILAESDGFGKKITVKRDVTSLHIKT
jgi:hypothetical protein